MLIIAKTDLILSAEDYQKWNDLYKNMIDSDFLLSDGRFTLYSVDDNGNVEEIEDKKWIVDFYPFVCYNISMQRDFYY